MGHVDISHSHLQGFYPFSGSIRLESKFIMIHSASRDRTVHAEKITGDAIWKSRLANKAIISFAL